jgi:hypothetical protein
MTLPQPLTGVDAAGPEARPGAGGCASVPRDSLGIPTEAIHAGERDSSATGQQNVMTTGTDRP